ncbi:MAG: radical SAM protein [Deltaproteobacteria bacterium]|jgi:radical SAM protein with 4Fe4S-binding SPASM domain|nr:radical SAM protein [Deltaproteobacteria bacterium]
MITPKKAPPRLVAFETTAACNLACRHCRAVAQPKPSPSELDPTEAATLVKRLAEWTPPPMLILSGGEPLLRPDIVDLAALATSLGLRALLSTNGTLLTPALAKKLKTAGVARVSLSLDGPTKGEHDDFRGAIGAYEGLIQGAAILLAAGLPFQINTTITPLNVHQLGAISAVATDLGAVAHHVFLLVPVGRAKDWLAPLDLDFEPERYETALKDLLSRESSFNLEFKATCAPQYNRLRRQLGVLERRPLSRGCLGGQGFMFVGQDGRVQACGYLPLVAGDIRRDHPIEIYDDSPLFKSLRRREGYHGSCGDCEYWPVCGGCRARAHAAGDYLGPEPLCPYQPTRKAS